MDLKNLPKIGLGTFNMGNVESTCEIIYNSIKDGTRLIDTAAVYGTEKGIGLGIKKAISEGLVKREDLFIITKCGKHAREDPETAIKG